MSKDEHYIPIQELLAGNSTKPSLALIKKYGLKAKNKSDLQYKLSELYKQHPDKLVIEKELAEIHPHKDWLIKNLNLVPKEEVKEEKTIVDVSPVSEAAVNNQIKNTVVHDGYSNCAGNPNCGCNKMSNACGCSGFDGTGKTTASNPMHITASNNTGLIVFGTVVIFALLVLKDKIKI